MNRSLTLSAAFEAGLWCFSIALDFDENDV